MKLSSNQIALIKLAIKGEGFFTTKDGLKFYNSYSAFYHGAVEMEKEGLCVRLEQFDTSFWWLSRRAKAILLKQPSEKS